MLHLNKIEIETRDFVTAETTTKTCYCGTSALTFLASEFDSENTSRWKDDKGKRYKSDVSTQYVNDIGDYLWVGEETDAAVKDYDVSKMKWILTRKE